MNSFTSRWNFKTALLALFCVGACAVPGAEDQEEIREEVAEECPDWWETAYDLGQLEEQIAEVAVESVEAGVSLEADAEEAGSIAQVCYDYKDAYDATMDSLEQQRQELSRARGAIPIPGLRWEKYEFSCTEGLVFDCSSSYNSLYDYSTGRFRANIAAVDELVASLPTRKRVFLFSEKDIPEDPLNDEAGGYHWGDVSSKCFGANIYYDDDDDGLVDFAGPLPFSGSQGDAWNSTCLSGQGQEIADAMGFEISGKINVYAAYLP